jgi:ATP-binding cassette, subfamily C, bacterial
MDKSPERSDRDSLPIAAVLRLLATVPRARLLVLLALTVLSGASEGVGLLLLVPALDLLGSAAGTGPAQGLGRLLAPFGLPMTLQAVLPLFIGVVLARNTIQYARERLAASLQFQLVDALRRDCLTAVLNAEWRWIVGQRQADHANLLLTEINRVGLSFNAGIGLAAGGTITAAYVCVAFLLSWKITALAVVSGGTVFLLLARHRRKALRLGRVLGDAGRALHADVQKSLSGIKLAKLLEAEGRLSDSILAAGRTLRSSQLAFTSGASLSKALFQTAGAVLVAFYVYVGLTIWQVPMAEILTLVVVFARLIPLFGNIQHQSHLWLHGLPAFAEIERLLVECRRVEQPKRRLDDPPLPLRRMIRLEGVCLRHDGRGKAALEHISLQFPARTTTAIVGSSGAGKSTLVDVIAGLLVPGCGTVEVDGVALTGPARARWRQTIGYVPQELFLFNDTIGANLRWARPDATDDDLRRALQQAAADFVLQLPQGLDTLVGDAGVRFSAGERQRIALARALLSQPDVLILDEATSSLDLESERRIQSVLDAMRGRMTIFIICHRRLYLDRADMVVVLRDGRVAATGPWNRIAALSEPNHEPAPAPLELPDEPVGR